MRLRTKSFFWVLCFSLILFTGEALQAFPGTGSIIDDGGMRYYGKLIKCSYKGRFKKTKTVECQLRLGNDSSGEMMQFSAEDRHWSKLNGYAGWQVMVLLQDKKIRYAETDLSLSQVTAIHNPRGVGVGKQLCGSLRDLEEGYSIGFRSALLVGLEKTDKELWQGKAFIGGSGKMPWEIHFSTKRDCGQKLAKLMKKRWGKELIIYYRQDGKDDDYEVGMIRARFAKK
ncbi:hypothetical protein ACQZV8_07920 [Magnetococcales bacterium HHB-1]